MEYWRRMIIFSFVFASCVLCSYGCQIDNHPLPVVTINIDDVSRGVIFDASTTNIDSIISVNFGTSVEGREYIDLAIEGSRLVMRTTELYERYEEYEIAELFGITAVFSCSGGSTFTYVFTINVRDTNNNPPEFLIPDGFVFNLPAPIPPGFIVTGCLSELVVKDIDLTTEEIVFDMEDNPYFEIEYDAESSKDLFKQYKAVIRAKAFIRNVPDAFRLSISATDVDRTNDPAITTPLTIFIAGDNNFVLPDEPVFSKTFYLAEYTDGNQLLLTEPLFLQSGYDEFVRFYIIGDFNNNFETVTNPDQENEVSIRVVTPLSDDVLTRHSIHLVVRADRELTSGATTTVVVQLPKENPLEFERAHYEGTIENNNLQVPQLTLTQGYEGVTVTAVVISEHSSYFSARAEGNTVTLLMTALDASIINENSFIYLQVVASTDTSSTSTVVTLEIIKDDNVTPVFSKPIYTGSYNPGSGLSLEPIVFLQGYDGITTLDLDGDLENYFQASRVGAEVNIDVSTIPSEEYIKGRIELSLQATKPRTVGAHATLIITLPEVYSLEFARAHYEGTIENNNLLVPQLTLTQGYEGVTVTAVVISEHSSYFSARAEGNTVTLSMTALDASIINENSFIYLQVVASTDTSSTSTVVTLEIIKDDNVTPVFSKPIYTGSYNPGSGLSLEPIVFLQGYDGITTLDLDGDLENYFQASRTGSVVNIAVSTIPPEAYSRGRVELSLLATKPRTVGANAAIIISLPGEGSLAFGRAHYEGTIENNNLQVPQLVLTQGYEGVTITAVVISEHSSYFSARAEGNTVTLLMTALDASIINENSFIYLQVVASTDTSSTSTVVTLEILKDDNVTPVFSKPIYTGSYNPGSGLSLEPIVFLQGHDGITTLDLDGDLDNYFQASRTGSVVNIAVSTIPPEAYSRGRVELSLLATKPRTVGANAAIIISLPGEGSLAFGRAHYEGTIENNNLLVPQLMLTQGYEGVTITAVVISEHSSYFSARAEGNTVTLSMTALDASIINENSFIYLQVVASTDTSSTSTVVTLEIIKDDNVTPVFSKPIYTGSYNPGSGLSLEPIVFLQGYDGITTLDLDGDLENYFQVSRTGSVVNIAVSTIPPEAYSRGRVELSLLATKPRTVGANAAIIISLPGEGSLAFGRAHYEGTIENNNLLVPQLVLTQGYEGVTITAVVISEHSSYFSARAEGNTVTLSMTALDASIINENSFIYLQVVASTDTSSTSTVVTLEIIKDDNVTPVFSKPIYTGSYNPGSGLSLEPIVFLQGYDGITTLDLDGDLENYFQASRTGSVVNIAVSTIPPEAYSRGRVELSLLATKPRTVGANAAIIISLPGEGSLAFGRAHYEGTIENNNLLVPQLVLTQSYEGVTITAVVISEHSSYFSARAEGNTVTLSMTALDASIINENSFIYLQVVASTDTSSTSTVVTLEIIKDDNVTPVFSKPIYTGSYNPGSGLSLEPIVFLQGYDGITTLDLDGDLENYFQASRTGSVVNIAVSTIPPEAYSRGRVELSLLATKPRTVGANAAIIISLPGEGSLAFGRAHYEGTIENNNLLVPQLVLTQGYEGVTITAVVISEHSSYFSARAEGNTVTLSMTALDASIINENSFIYLQVVASTDTSSTSTVVTLEIIKDDNVTPVFSKPIYTGSYNPGSGLSLEPIVFLQGYDGITTLDLDGDLDNYFQASRTGSVVNIAVSTIPPEAYSRGRVELSLLATKPRTVGANAAIIISLPGEGSLAFGRAHYEGTIENNNLLVPQLVLTQGYEGVTITAVVISEHSSYFSARAEGNTVTLSMTALDASIINENSFIYLQVVASTDTSSTSTVVTLEIIKDDNITPVFSKPIYTGSYNPGSGLSLEPIVFLQGYDGITTLDLDGDLENYFQASRTGSVVNIAVSTIPPEAYSRGRVELSLLATKPRTVGANAAIIISLPGEGSLAFERAHYEGTIENNNLQVPQLMLTQGYEGITITAVVISEHSSSFSARAEENTVTLSMTALDASIINENSFIYLQVVASTDTSSTSTVVTLEIIKDDNVTPVFSKPIYTGSYNPGSGLSLEPIVFLQGYDGITTLDLEGEYKNHFKPTLNNAYVIIEALSIPPEVYSRGRIELSLQVTKPRTVGANTAIIIVLPGDTSDVSFEKVFYQGVIQANEIHHEVIRITGIDETIVDIFGVYSSLFGAQVSNGEVKVTSSGALYLPPDVTHVALELHAGGASTVLLFDVLEADAPLIPSVTFSSESYMLTVDVEQTGLVGRVSAVADNRETIIYTINTDNAHLQMRLSINNVGELYLSAPAYSGVYTFQVIATTTITQSSGSALVHLTVDVITECEDKAVVMPPLIVLDRDEEQVHNNLVVLDSTQHKGCHFTLTNRWPTDQTWLHVDEYGLHARVIDREDPSIALMALSQVQVELALHCDSDNAIRAKRSLRTDWLGPYDYGENKWLLTDSIPYNSRRSLVNLIVNDINDNHPKFIGKEHEPIVVGYPTHDLEERILPRSLAELKATDADVGENAALKYWSSESVLAVAPTTGFVHVRSGARVQHNQLLNVTATDRNGHEAGLSGTIQLMVKLLDLNHIAVVTVRDAFLDDETTVLAHLSDTVGYEIKALRSVIISDDTENDATRNTREANFITSSLQLYVYGINAREPVTVDRLVDDIINNAAIVNVVQTIPLEDYLEDNILERSIGLLVSTIVLSVLLFVLIVLTAIWFYLRWRKNRNYDELSETILETSSNASLGESPKFNGTKPRLNIADLKKSEKRLQERLDAPIEEVRVEPTAVTVEPVVKLTETPVEAKLDLPILESNGAIVIQSIDKLKDGDDTTDDEFGEVKPSARRKSVVTFNENVEKIIHVEDNADDNDDDNDDDNEDNNDDDDDDNNDSDDDDTQQVHEVYRL